MKGYVGKASGMEEGAGIQGMVAGAPNSYRAPQWERTPVWQFWRPAWRKANIEAYDPDYTYQTQRQRARAVLAEQFDQGRQDGENHHPTRPGTRQQATQLFQTEYPR